MAKRILDYDPLTKTTTWHDFDHSSGKTLISQSQDVSAIIENNKRLAADSNYKRQGIKTEYYHFATVPNSVMHDIMTKYRVNPFRKEDLPRIEKILSSNEYRYLRTVDKI